ncbi:MAG: UMP kinase [Endomicrobiales bacterium]
MKYKRILLKLSGETLAGDASSGINADGLKSVAREIKAVWQKKVEIAVVIGAGNLWRGAGKSIDRVTADHMGMLATVINALALKDALRVEGIGAGVFSAIDIPGFVTRYMRDSAVSFLECGNVVICAGGTGNPFFTTDTTAALRAAELEAEVLLKATQVDGVYEADPKKNPAAKKFPTLSFDDAIEKQLKIMDTAAFSLCKENDLPIIVFDFHKKGNLEKVVSGRTIGTLIR